ncbi:MMPL family protein [Rubripirellula amarantea]|uniref:MMPL family protein n=1 Tax=Rubripirellula amarantea TaxID=2527999 RepID=A0A5C5WME6_9BACT|nr:MMPL family transporter [Rubripirellula amarantea]TWT51183.1 MMPL family protein [Rubripirellula amarantea]
METASEESDKQETDPLMRRYLRRLWVGVAVLVVLAIPAIIHSDAAIRSLFNRPSDWVPDSLAEKAEFNDFAEHFSVADLIMVAWEESTLGSPSLAQASAILQPLSVDQGQPSEDVVLPDWADEWIAEMQTICGDPHPLQWARSGDETLQTMTSSPASIPREMAISRLVGTLIGPDREHTCLVVSLHESGLSKRRELIPAIREMVGRLVDRSALDVAVVGGPFEGAVVDAESIRSIKTFSPPSAIIAAILCLFCLRSVPLTTAIVAVAVIGEGLVLAAVYYTGTPMNAVLIVLPPLVFVLTVSAGIHLSNYYLDITKEFPHTSRSEAASRAMRAGVMPCMLATGTTVIGLMSLILVRLGPVRIFGAVASLGVILTLGLLVLVLPGAMVLTKPRKKYIERALNQDSAIEERNTAKIWFRRRMARPWPIIVTFLTIAGFLSVGLSRLESSVNVPRMFLPDSDIRTSYAWFERNIGPTITGELLLTFPAMTEEDDLIERFAIVEKVQIAINHQSEVGGTLSPRTFVRSIPRGRSIRDTITRSGLIKQLRDPESALGQLGFIANDPDRQLWRISIRIPHDEFTDIGDQIDAIKASADEAIEDASIPVQATFTGGVAIVHKSQEILLRDLFWSFVTAFGVIAVVMVVMLRSVIGGLIAMLPNLFPTVALFGMMGLIRLPLDIGSVMSASVALGIAVDDTVHLLSRFGSRRARGIGQIRAAYGALAQCGMAMVQTTLVCGVALMAYWFSDFVPTSRFSLFMFGLLMSALLGVTFLLPALMCSVLGKWLARPIGVDPGASVYADGPQTDPDDVRRVPTRWQN